MSINIEAGNIEQLMAEAEDLVQQIHSENIGNLKEECHLRFETHAQKLNKIKFEVLGNRDKRKTCETDAEVECSRAAVLEIVRTFRELKGCLD